MRKKLYDNIVKVVQQLKKEYYFFDIIIYDNKLLIKGKDTYKNLEYILYTNKEQNKLKFEWPKKAEYVTFKKIYENLKVIIDTLIKKQNIVLKRKRLLNNMLYNDFIFENFQVFFEENALKEPIKLSYNNISISHAFIYEMDKNKFYLKLYQKKFKIKELKNLKNLKLILLKLNKFNFN